jgi:hypothetical protein
MKMNLLEWNVNCAVGSKYGIKNLKSLFRQKPAYDILILTEFYRLEDYGEFEKQFRDWGYESFITMKQDRRNDVFIAVSKEYNPILHEIQGEREGMPDFLAVSAKTDDKEFSIVGVRFYGDYRDMHNQFITFLPHINAFENTIIGGDFNNGKIHGEENAIYTERQIDCLYTYSEKEIIKKYEQFEYNYHRIKLWLAQNKFSLVTPIKGISCPYKLTYTGGSKIDHFATKGIQVNNAKYLSTEELSDHNQLLGEIII